MSDSAPKKEAAIPSWQRPASTTQTDQSSATSLLQKAKQFLDDEAVESEPRERKIAFLESKGIPKEMVEQLLDTQDEPPLFTEKDEEEDMKTVHDSDSDEASQATTSTPSESTTSSTLSTRRDIPPIITYPEFLLKPQKPPPLVTLDRLLTATYIFAGAAALTYRASKYLVKPMLETLTDSRHDLAQTALKNLKELNTKLEATVSHVPYIASSRKEADGHEPDDDSVVSDPTELFHRDMATQTTPALSCSTSSASLDSQGRQTKPKDPIEDQTQRLKSLHSTLSTLLTAPNTAQESLKESIKDFQETLDKLENTYNPFRSEYSMYTASSTNNSTTNAASKRSQSDEAAKFKAEIRTLKGAILSTRNFPTARPPTYSNPR